MLKLSGYMTALFPSVFITKKGSNPRNEKRPDFFGSIPLSRKKFTVLSFLLRGRVVFISSYAAKGDKFVWISSIRG